MSAPRDGRGRFVFLVPAAVAQLYAALAASALAAYDSYGTAAAGYALGSVVGLAVILWRVGEDGIVACAWGTLVNGSSPCSHPLTGLLLRADWGRRVALDVGSRFAELARAAALPIVLQAFFVVCLRFASGLGTGAVTSFTYAYFVAAALVAVTASSLGMVSSVPLTRGSLSDERAARTSSAPRSSRSPPSPRRPASSRSSASRSSVPPSAPPTRATPAARSAG